VSGKRTEVMLGITKDWKAELEFLTYIFSKCILCDPASIVSRSEGSGTGAAYIFLLLLLALQ
jgi:hypothetical protein